MDSTDRKSPFDQLGRVKAGIWGTLQRSSEHANSNASRVFTDVKAWNSKNAAAFHGTPAGKTIDSSFQAIGRSSAAVGRNLQTWTENCAGAILSQVTSVRNDFDTLRQNVRRNVRTLTSGGVRTIDTVKPWAMSSSASSEASNPSSSKEMLVREHARDELGQSQAESHSYHGIADFVSTQTDYPISEVNPEEEDRSDQPIGATSVFSIGSVGSPLVIGSGKFDEAFITPGQGGLDPGQVVLAAPPFLKLEKVRRSIGKALMIYKKIRSLGLPENSWENKMPWRKPAPPRLAKGLRWPQGRFSSVAERTEYHRRMRRRGRYLIGPTPGWSWFAADLILLHLLINNHTRNFLM